MSYDFVNFTDNNFIIPKNISLLVISPTTDMIVAKMIDIIKETFNNVTVTETPQDEIIHQDILWKSCYYVCIDNIPRYLILNNYFVTSHDGYCILDKYQNDSRVNYIFTTHNPQLKLTLGLNFTRMLIDTVNLERSCMLWKKIDALYDKNIIKQIETSVSDDVNDSIYISIFADEHRDRVKKITINDTEELKKCLII